MMKTPTTLLIVLTFTTLLAACQTAPTSEIRRAQLHDHSASTVHAFKDRDPTIERFFDMSHAYAVFPSVARGGAGIGGAHGRGIAYVNGQAVAWCEVSQATIGAQLGGQSFSQIVFFETEDAFEQFKTGNFAFSANASAVAAQHGAGASADYERGVAVFTLPRGGLMFEASIGGQKFDYEPM